MGVSKPKTTKAKTQDLRPRKLRPRKLKSVKNLKNEEFQKVKISDLKS